MRIEFEVRATIDGSKCIVKMSVLADKIELHYCEDEGVDKKLWLRIDGVYYYPVVQDYLSWVGLLGTGFVLK